MGIFNSKLGRQLAITIAIFIFLVEGVLLVFSLQSKKSELLDLKNKLEVDVMEKMGKNFHDLHPGILDEQDIKKRMDEFRRNIILLTFVICFSVIFGTLIVFYQFSGKHIFKLAKINRRSIGVDHFKPIYFPDTDIPNNEVGELIEARNLLFREVNNYQTDLEGKLDEAKMKLVQSAKLAAVGEFTSSIIHDINNPLSIILMSSEVNSGTLQNEDKILKKFKNIHLAAGRINALVKRMSSWSRQDIKKEKVEVVDLIDNSIVFLGQKIKSNKVEVNQLVPEDIFVTVDPIGIEQVISNLISNACDALEGSVDPQIEITCIENAGMFEITVSDNGVGIPEDIQKKIFESFFTTKERGKGTGLGLSNCKQLINSAGGEISLSSTLGEGTSFSISIPKSA